VCGVTTNLIKVNLILVNYLNSAQYILSGSLVAVSGPFARFLFFPTLVGIGGSYFFFLSLSSFFSPPAPPPAE